ncbi:MAG: hypothetical protein ACTSW7_05385 [Candidatus Thorarchaeota archaeon]
MSELRGIYEKLTKDQEIFVMPVRMKDEKIFIPTDDEEFAIIGVDYFLQEEPLMLFAPKQIMEAWFYGAGAKPGKDLPLEIHVPGDLISEHGGIPLLRLKFIREHEYTTLVSEIQNDQVTTYTSEKENQ